MLGLLSALRRLGLAPNSTAQLHDARIDTRGEQTPAVFHAHVRSVCRRPPCGKLWHRGYPRRDQTPNGLTPIRIDVRADSDKKPTLGIH